MVARSIRSLGVLSLLCCIGFSGAALAEQIPVRYPQGSSRGFLVLKTLDGVTLASGESTQTVRGDVVTSKLVFRFRDGSIDEDVTIFSQREVFRLLSDHHIQRGPSFPKPSDFLLDAVTGDTTFRSEDSTVTHEHMELPSDVANGLPPNLLLNIPPTTAETKISYVAPGKKARLVEISIKPTGTMPFRLAGAPHRATDFTLHIALKGVAGVVAPLVGKQPADYHIWLLGGAPPAFVCEEGPLYEGGPIWRIEQIVPSFRRPVATNAK